LANPKSTGIAKKKIIVVPCIVNSRLKTCGDTKSLCGYINWIRIRSASTPATTRNRNARKM
jgi:hypothetical protein